MSEMRGITFISNGVSKHTADDWDLIMSEKVIEYPAPRIKKVDMDDRDGEIDLTENMRGRVSYKNRALSFTFICTAHQSTWADLRAEIAGFIHGKRLRIIDPDTPNHYYVGRCTLHEPSYKGEAIMFLTVTVDADPYRLSNTLTVVEKSVSAGDLVNLVNGTMPTTVTVAVDADMTIFTNGTSFALAKDSVYVDLITLNEGMTLVRIDAGSGTIKFSYRQGAI